MPKQPRAWTWTAGLAGLALSTGCALGPTFRRPALEIPAAYPAQTATATEALSADLGWWEIVNDDPVLKGLVLEALKKNHDLQIAVSRMEEARALAGINRLGPDLDLGGTATRKRALSSTGGTQTVISDNFSAGFAATWELDIWGRIRRTQESALAQYLASEQGRRAVFLSLVGDVVGSYYQLQSLDMKLETARRTVEVRKRALALVESRVLGGVGDKLETSQAASALALAEAAVPQLELAVQTQENQINLLLGRMPGPVPRGVALQAVPPKAIAPGLPSELLERRPDVRQKEELLRAANAQVGVATANLFPSLTLTGSLGYQSVELAGLTSSGQQSWSAGGGILAPIFHGGALRYQRKAAIARWEQARASYERTVLSAFGDVSNALTGVAKAKEIVTAQEQLLRSLREAERIATMRFEGGVSPYLEVLDAQRQLFSAELSYAEALSDQQRSVIRLYLALGGGWKQPDRPKEPANPAAKSSN
ncbi:efflux transporter outer membrane subunit [Geothrix oryzisoli]|uniref:efflux transporter outer membrane subunit n=1 Tax=Geothrix oryzisoli TaxID=2922721 RepID=UPI001FAC7E6B|nr:efflux transporter outer membrane subunit [Geothrix oryzisoli]